MPPYKIGGISSPYFPSPPFDRPSSAWARRNQRLLPGVSLRIESRRREGAVQGVAALAAAAAGAPAPCKGVQGALLGQPPRTGERWGRWGRERMSSHLELEERLREAAALGDLEEVQTLLDKGVEVNAQNEINGWTCLHWACKRNHTQVVSYLLDSQADKEIFTVNGELAAHLTSKKEIRKLLGVEECDNQEVNDLKLPNAGDSLTNPSFPCVDYQGKANAPHLLAPPEDNRTATSESEPSPRLSATQLENTCTPISLHAETELSEDLHERDLPSPISSGVSECTMTRVQSCPVYPSSTSHNRALLTSTVPRQHVPQQANGCCMGTAPPLQPLLLTGTFSYNMQELVLKVRVQNPKENDFFEIELDRQELTYQDLLRVSCHELGINPEQVEKVRKLPNTLIRKDKDVARLQDFQELELVLVRSISSPFRNASATLMERPCYNTKAAKLTY